MITLNKTEQFVSFCIECYRQKNDLDGGEVFEIFEKYKVFDFLEQGYEVLHTQGKQYILEEIEFFVTSKSSKK